jgi:hypothetical protein
MTRQVRSTSYGAASGPLSELRVLVAGRVISPEDATYEAARRVFHGGIDRCPAAIVGAREISDVSRVVTLACEGGP